jgi:hypothetical protein
MKLRILMITVASLSALNAFAAAPALTIYNQNFAVVRDSVPLDLEAGVNRVRFAGTTAHVEPDSVMLRDPSGKQILQILEQNYRADPLSQELLLSLNEGKRIDFEIMRQVQGGETKREIIQGKIVRSGYVPHQAAFDRYGSYYAAQQRALAYGPGTGQPIIEVEGRLRFTLPGQPLFPSLGDDTILKPTLLWVLRSDKATKFEAQLSYVTGGMRWSADYNLVSPEKADELDLIGWVTMDNQSGKSFENASIKLMAGDVQKIQNQEMDTRVPMQRVIPWNNVRPCLKKPSTNITFTLWSDRRLCSTGRPSKWSLFARPASSRSRFTCMTV